jgi:two-component system sensor histidine kinase KdpD
MKIPNQMISLKRGSKAHRGQDAGFGPWRDIVLAVAIASASAAGAILLDHWIDQTSSALIIVLGVVIAGAMFGLVASVTASIVAFLLFNFFIAEPTMVLRLATGQDLAPLLAFSLTALVTGALAGRLKDREQAAQLANIRLASLLSTSKALQSTVMPESVASAIASAGVEGANLEYRATGIDVDGQVGGNRSYPVVIAGETVGALYAGAGTTAVIDGNYLATVSALIALALERADLSARVADAIALARSEELKTALLSSVSHDLRTPLTAIIASASSLADYSDALPPEARLSLLQTIVSEGERLDRFTANLLELSRLQSGAPIPTKILDPADIVISATTRSRARIDHQLTGRVPSGAYLVRADAQLFEAAVANILENAAVHGGNGPIEISARADGDQFELGISDHGPGIPAAERERVFDRFYRLDPMRPGSGLGLAIAKGFVAASGGSVVATERQDGLPGTRILVSLPLARDGLPRDLLAHHG